MKKLDRDVRNYLAIIHDLASKSEEWISRPAWIEFATNNCCNLKCVMCTHADGEPLRKMNKQDATSVLDQVLPNASVLTPSAGSEPLLGNFNLIMEQCRKYDVHLNMITNATLLDGKKFREIAERIQKIFISFDSHIPEIYEKIRTPAKFDDVVHNIRDIFAVAADLKIPVGIVVVLMADNAPDIPDFVDFIADLGGDKAKVEIRLQPLLYISSNCKAQEVMDRFSTDQLLTIMQQAVKRATGRGIIMNSELPGPLYGNFAPVTPFVRGVSGDILMQVIDVVRERYPYFCSMASSYMKISPDGSVFPCCRSPDELCMGNILLTSYEEVWNNEKYRAFRRSMNLREYPAVCKDCSVLVGNPDYPS